MHYITLSVKRNTRIVMVMSITIVTLCEFKCERDSLSRAASNNIRHSRIIESQACQQQFFCSHSRWTEAANAAIAQLAGHCLFLVSHEFVWPD